MNLGKSPKLVLSFEKGNPVPYGYWNCFSYKLGYIFPLKIGNSLQHIILIRNHIRKSNGCLAGFRKIQRFLSNRPTPIRRLSFNRYLEKHELVDYEYRRNYN